MLRDSEKAEHLDMPAKFAKKVSDCDHVPINEKYPFIEEDDNDVNAKQERLAKDLERKLIHKQNLVRKNGKGKYDVTVPILFDFQKYPNEGKSSRQAWLEEEERKRKAELNKHLTTRIKPTPIPASTTQPKYEKLLE